MVESAVVKASNEKVKRGVIVWAIKNFAFLVIFASIIIGGSGRLDWVMGWAYFAFLFLYIALMGVVLYRLDPSLLAERSGPQKGSKKWDLVLASLIAVWLPLTIYLVAALNKRFGWAPEVPLWLQVAGLAFAVIGGLIVLWAMTANRFFSVVVRIQDDRVHQVATSGPYKFIRHPGYAAVFLYHPGAALALGSAWGLVPAVLIVVLTVIRTALEDKTLHRELPGYKEYAAKVKYRLLPGIW